MEKHPCVILLHGLPGYTTNQDIGQALRRLGFVVLNPFYRGAWGSQGKFTLSGMIQDVAAVVAWCQSREALDVYGIDGGNLFLLGISMGGWAAIHGLLRCPEIRGAVAISPADVAYLAKERPQLFENAYNKYGCLQIETPESLMQEATLNRDDLDLLSRAGELKGRPLMLIGGNRDSVIPPERVLDPFWEAMKQQNAVSDKEYVILEAEHSFANCRMKLTQILAQWLLDQVQKDSATA